eukprot:TRINITY_DN60561_c0_g1_i1.p1 TRINITY_DN60561_c0_g1~~TRINITY_DN60561_c0_g1_i1.p1  ORF type:complete len:686 (+),score=56.82 TRINITY_DN60561_c0_g1_i1:77-2134(+)
MADSPRADEHTAILVAVSPENQQTEKDEQKETAGRCGCIKECNLISVYDPNVQAAVRIIGLVALSILLALLLSFGVSLLLQACYEAFSMDNGTFDSGMHIFVQSFMLPWLIMLVAVLCSECVTLCLDMVDRPPLPAFRSLITVIFARSSFSSGGRLIDKIIVVSGLVCLAFWIARIPLCGVTWAACLLASQAVAKIYVFSSGPRMQLWLAHRDKFYHIRMEEDYEVGNAPGCEVLAEQGEQEDASHVATSRWLNPRVHLFIFFAMQITMTLILTIALQSSRFRFVADLYSVKVASICILIGLVVSIHRTLPKGTTWGFGHHFVSFSGLFLFIAFALLLFEYTRLMGGTADGTQSIFAPRPSPQIAAHPVCSVVSPQPDAYPVCSMRWGNASDDLQRLDVIDMLVFADAAYGDDEEHACELASNSTTNTHLSSDCYTSFEDSHAARPFVWEIPRTPPLHPLIHPVSTPLPRNDSEAGTSKPTPQVCVIAFRGTHVVNEILLDAYMWSTIKGMQLFDEWVPLFNLLPRHVLERLLVLAHWRVWFGEELPWEHLVRYASNIKAYCESLGYELLLTGHSLGGGMAQIIAGRLGSPAVVFSPVGVSFSSSFFGIDLQTVMKSVVAVVPVRDPVPSIDEQAGLLQPIDCTAESAMGCHGLRQTGCELITACGDRRGRVADCSWYRGRAQGG